MGSSEDTGYSSKGASAASGDSVGSEVEHFDEVPGCGCDKPCSIYTLCARGCPRPTNTKVGVVKKRAHDQVFQDELLPEEEAEVEDYAEKFEKDTKRMRIQFAAFVSDMCCSFKKHNVTTDALTLYLQNASPLALKPRINEMNKATSLEQVLKIVTSQACSWFDYEVMKDLIDYFGDEQDKMLLDKYEANFRKFAEQRLPKGKKHIEVGSGARRGGVQLIIKMDKEWNEVTFHDLRSIRGNLASILGVHRRELYLADIREGCMMMTFTVSEELAGRLFPIKDCLTSSQVKSLKDESIILLKCGKLSWRSLLVDSSKYQELSENLTSICTKVMNECYA